MFKKSAIGGYPNKYTTTIYDYDDNYHYYHSPKARFPLPVNSGAFFDTHQLGPSTRLSKNAPEFTGRLTGRQLGP